MKNLKGFTIQQLGTIAVFFVVAAITISIGSQILEDLQKQQCEINSSNVWIGVQTNTTTGCCLGYVWDASNLTQCIHGDDPNTAFNISGKGITGIATLGDWLPLIALVIAAAVVIGILIRYLGGVVAGGT